MPKNVLLAYITDVSGHRSAANAVEKALKMLDPSTKVLSLNLFNYTNPRSEKVINYLYTGMIKRVPKIWEYLYDNPKVVKRTRHAQDIVHKFNARKIKSLFDRFNPDVIACTQAFPCGMFADFKKIYHHNTPLVGIVTDFMPHTYWVYDSVDYYVVPSEEARSRLVQQGVSSKKIKMFGIPIDPKFSLELDKQTIAKQLGIDPSKPTVLVMGGGQGLGPIKKIVKSLDRLETDLQLIIVTGTNAKLYKKLKKRAFSKNNLILKYVDNVDELMSISSIVVTKPGGMTISEALVKGLIPVIINPIPGQEQNNTDFLINNNAAFTIDKKKDAARVIGDLLTDRKKFEVVLKNIRSLAKPKSALDIAQHILKNV